MAWAYWWRTAPWSAMPAGHETMHGSLTPPRYVSRFQRRNGVVPAQVHPHE